MTVPNTLPEEPAEGRAPDEAAVFEVIERYRGAVVSELRETLEGRSGPPFPQMRYHLGWEDPRGRPVDARGGKLLRPALCLLSCQAAGGNWRRATPAAAALELLHNFTLIHDDVEDASRRRHGRETLWSLWGEAQAINVGDGMFALAHVALLRLDDHGHEPERILRAVRMFDEAALRLCEGQHRDLTAGESPASTQEAYVAMIEGKTAALLATCCGIGALLGGADQRAVDGLFEFGRRLGLAFQVRDDFLGIWGDPSQTGKPAGDDLREGKRSYPVVIALERAAADQRRALEAILASAELSDHDLQRANALLEELGARTATDLAARQHTDAAIAALDGLPLETQRRNELEQLARFAAERHA